jgi:hypothetical protein
MVSIAAADLTSVFVYIRESCEISDQQVMAIKAPFVVQLPIWLILLSKIDHILVPIHTDKLVKYYLPFKRVRFQAFRRVICNSSRLLR